MKASELLRDQQKVIKNVMPDMLCTVREIVGRCADSFDSSFIELGRELAQKEAMFMAMGGFQIYFDMMDILIRIVEAAEALEGGA